MEFPNLGSHCFSKECNRLDFLPMKCDACSNVFCKDCIYYSNHSCENAYKKDVQVPVCPLCNKPVPVKRGEPPDIVVGQHIDRDCMSDPAVSNRKVYTNKCSLKGCKQKELIPVTCSSCQRNYCLRHRHPTDHDCQEVGPGKKPMSAAGAAALARVQKMKSNNSSFKNIFNKAAPSARPSNVTLSSLQAGMSEDEALAMALQKSMTEVAVSPPLLRSQEEEDRLLAEALAASEREHSSRTGSQEKAKSCTLS